MYVRLHALGTVAAIVIASSAAPPSAIAQPPSQPQCTCEPGTNPGDGARFLSAITNGALCVSTPGANQPVCNIQVYCLSDGTGSGCPAHQTGLQASATAAAVELVGDFEYMDFVQQLDQFVSQLTDVLPAGAEMLGYNTFDVLSAIRSEEEVLLSCFSDFGRRVEDTEPRIGFDLSCVYSPILRSLIIGPGENSEFLMPHIQIVAHEGE